MPLTVSGKKDRLKLQQHSSALTREDLALLTADQQERRALGTTREAVLQRLCSCLLDVSMETIGLDGSFFRMGGDSIAAMKLVTMARLEGWRVSVASIFSHPKLSDLALTMYVLQTVTNQPPPASSLLPDGSFDHARDTVRQSGIDEVPGSVFDFTNQRSFIESIDCTSLPLEISDIHDALPTPQGEEYRLHHGSYYFMLDLDGPIDCNRLEGACRALVQCHTILRTVFIPYQVRLAQVVLRNSKALIGIVNTDDYLLPFTEFLCQRDSREAPIPGYSITRMTLVQGPDNRTTLILRLSHAQYDGISITIMWRDLVDLYEGRHLPDAVEYSVHVQKWLAGGTFKAYKFRRELLGESSMTYISHTHVSETDVSVSLLIGIESKITVPDLPHGITMTNLIKTAWSLVLARLTGDRNVVFGQINHGRSTSNFL